jgi:hypothetical protein
MKTNLIMGVAGAVLLFAASAQAATFQSDLVNEASNVGSPTAITPVGVWDATGPGIWVSYAATGAGGIVAPDTTYPGAPTMVYTEALSGSGFLNSLQLWADDTAEAFLVDGLTTTQLIAITDASPAGSCVVGTPTCTPGGQGIFAGSIAFGPGAFIEFRAYQLAGDGFGIKYDGTTSPVPVPAALPLLLSGLAGLGFISRRKA